jgi:hypothetical protein
MLYVTIDIKKPIIQKIKYFQVNCVNWSNLYRGNVPLIAIAKTHIINTFINNTK